MKTQATANEDISYEFWETPVKESRLYLLTILQDSRHVRFFLQEDLMKKKNFMSWRFLQGILIK